MARLITLAALLATFTLGAPVAFADNLTHLGQPVNNLVTVKCTGCIMHATPSSPFPSLNEIVNPDASTTPFVVPNGQVFVITDVEWFMVTGGKQLPAGSNVFLILNLAKKNNPSNYISVFASKAVPVINGTFSMHESLTAGIVVAPNVSILPEMINSRINLAGATVIVHGYFMPDPQFMLKYPGKKAMLIR